MVVYGYAVYRGWNLSATYSTAAFAEGDGVAQDKLTASAGCSAGEPGPSAPGTAVLFLFATIVAIRRPWTKG